MNLHCNKTFIAFTLFLFALTSCSVKTEGQKKFNADSDYFIGLKLLAEGNEKAAKTKFLNCEKKGSYYCSLRSAQTLCSFGTIEEKNLACENLLKKYNDEHSIYIAASHYYSCKEYGKLIRLTDNIDFETASNKLIKLRILALKERRTDSYYDNLYRWFMESKITNEHYSFFRDSMEHPDFSNILTVEEGNYSPELFAINYRIELYRKNYLYCYENADRILDYLQRKQIPATEQIASDLGKAYLYGNADVIKNAIYFSKLAEQYKNTDQEFYFWFYAGRLYEKASIYYRQSTMAFENAIRCSKTPAQKDNAIWYLLNTSLSYSNESVVKNLEKYSGQWSDPEYFDDFFDSLSVALFSTGNWETFGTIYKSINGHASPFCTAQFAYIYARMIQEGYVKADRNQLTKAFETAYNSGSQPYYRVISTLHLNNLGYTKDRIEELQKKYALTREKNIDQSAETLLEGYAYFGFPEKIFSEWYKIGSDKFSEDCCIYLSSFLKDCSTGNDDYLHQSLRIGVRTSKDLTYMYPRNYQEIVEKYAAEYNLEPAVLYALIRSESFFDPDVNSTAGAIGLTQLMEFTASDVARKLKVSDYDLTDPETNIRFGAWYLSDLVRRFDNSYLLAFFSYNAGAARVRRWLQTSIVDYGKKSNLPLDLFLESLPYSETREYGRKLISATVIYDWLYSENPDETAQALLSRLIKSGR